MLNISLGRGDLKSLGAFSLFFLISITLRSLLNLSGEICCSWCKNEPFQSAGLKAGVEDWSRTVCMCCCVGGKRNSTSGNHVEVGKPSVRLQPQGLPAVSCGAIWRVDGSVSLWFFCSECMQFPMGQADWALYPMPDVQPWAMSVIRQHFGQTSSWKGNWHLPWNVRKGWQSSDSRSRIHVPHFLIYLLPRWKYMPHKSRDRF